MLSGNANPRSGVEEKYKIPKQNINTSWSATTAGMITEQDDSTVTVKWFTEGRHSLKLRLFETSILYDKTYIYYINVKVRPQKPIIMKKDSLLYSSSETGNQWYLNNEIMPDATNNFLIPDVDGLYTVQVTGENGCLSEISEPYNFISGINFFS